MIAPLQHTDTTIAQQMRSVFQASYAVEAELLNAVDFPPLQRPLTGYTESTNAFLGYWQNDVLAAVIELDERGTHTHIQSLVVHPQFFRQGIARQLLSFVVDAHAATLLTVETGVDNGPACALYKAFAFEEVRQYDTDHGVRKVRFEKRP